MKAPIIAAMAAEEDGLAGFRLLPGKDRLAATTTRRLTGA
jgi:hypothetical protein